jgi:hypothetical protein
MIGNKNQHTYILRFWQEDGSALDSSARKDESKAWRFYLEPVFEREKRYGFGSFEALVEFLKEEMANSQSQGAKLR